MSPLTVSPVKILNFQNLRRTAAILKNVKSRYLRNPLTNFDEIWHDARTLGPYHLPTIKKKFLKSHMAVAATLEKQKIAVSHQRRERSS